VTGRSGRCGFTFSLKSRKGSKWGLVVPKRGLQVLGMKTNLWNTDGKAKSARIRRCYMTGG
jgi:hypothetical protein